MKRLLLIGFWGLATVATLYPFITRVPQPIAEQPVEVAPEVEPTSRHNVNLPDFAGFRDVSSKKAAFINFLRPYVESQLAVIVEERKQLDAIIADVADHKTLTDSQWQQMAALQARYKVDDADLNRALAELQLRVDIVPLGMVLMQAANESAWGTSRFANEGLNFFGQWCFRQGCGLVPDGRDGDAKHEVAAFTSVEAGIASYLLNINTHPAYDLLRSIRGQYREAGLTPDAYAVMEGLLSYSERGEAYVEELSNMLRSNEQFL